MRSWLDAFEDTDLPVLSSLVGSLRGNGAAPAVDEGWDRAEAGAVAPMSVPLESLQSLPVASRML
jgi:hypothetical protein